MRFDCIRCRKATIKPQGVKGAFVRMLTINAYIGQYIFGTSQWAEYHRLFEYFASELEQVPEPVELKFLVIVEFDEAMCRPDDDRLIYMVKQALENNSIDIYRGLQNPIITFSIQAIDNK